VLKIIPSLSEILDGRIAVNKIREVQIEDLLERAPVCFDLALIATYIKDKRVLVTGAGGSIGSEICRQVLALSPCELYMLGHGENSIYEIGVELSAKATLTPISLIGDIRDRIRLENIFSRCKPQVVFHAAAHKHVPLMEQNSIEAAGNNILGTQNLVEFALEYGVEKFIFLSTDKAVNPVSVMGASKKLAEMVVLKASQEKRTKFVIVRFGNVLGSRGSVIPTFTHQIKAGGPVTVTHADMKRYFMTIPEAVHLVLEAGALSRGGEIFILDMGKPVKIIDLAKNMIRLSGFEVDKDIKIEVKGIRPGEKMEEELVNYGEDIEETDTCKIMKVKTEQLDFTGLERVLGTLKGLMENYDEEGTRALLLLSFQDSLPEHGHAEKLSSVEPESFRAGEA
jgi:FlaA1/EpsC-like NDP-sugar epimerase